VKGRHARAAGLVAGVKLTDVAALLMQEEVVVFDHIGVVQLQKHLAFCQCLSKHCSKKANLVILSNQGKYIDFRLGHMLHHLIGIIKIVALPALDSESKGMLRRT
jgi:hypothetical protein